LRPDSEKPKCEKKTLILSDQWKNVERAKEARLSLLDSGTGKFRVPSRPRHEISLLVSSLDGESADAVAGK
jgi:hypothetical protein